jgi:hypothetical protein
LSDGVWVGPGESSARAPPLRRAGLVELWLDAPATTAAECAEENEDDYHDEDDQKDAHGCTTLFSANQVRLETAAIASSSDACTDSAT